MILDFPYTPSQHLAHISFEQAQEHYDRVLLRFCALDIGATRWFRQASDRRDRAISFYNSIYSENAA